MHYILHEKYHAIIPTFFHYLGELLFIACLFLEDDIFIVWSLLVGVSMKDEKRQ